MVLNETAASAFVFKVENFYWNFRKLAFIHFDSKCRCFEYFWIFIADDSKWECPERKEGIWKHRNNNYNRLLIFIYNKCTNYRLFLEIFWKIPSRRTLKYLHKEVNPKKVKKWLEESANPITFPIWASIICPSMVDSLDGRENIWLRRRTGNRQNSTCLQNA